MRLCGNDIDESTTALEAGLGWMIGWSNERFIGREALQRQRARACQAPHRVRDGRPWHRAPWLPGGPQRRGDWRRHQRCRRRTRKKAIGMAYVPIDLSKPGTGIEIDVRGRVAQARVVPMPFYKRGRDVLPG